MRTIDDQVMKVSVGNFGVGPDAPTMDLPDRFIPVKDPGDLANALEQLLDTPPPAEQKLGHMQLTHSDGQITIRVSMLGSTDSSTYVMDDQNAGELVAELRKAADPSFNSCLVAFSK